MDAEHIAIINSHLQYIVLNMDTKRTLDELLSSGTLSNPVYTKIMRISCSDDANRELLAVLKKTPGAYGNFIIALKNTQQYEVLQKLQSGQNNSANVPASASSPALGTNLGAQLRDMCGGPVNINIAHGNMHLGNASEQQSASVVQHAQEAPIVHIGHNYAKSMPQLDSTREDTSAVEEFDGAYKMEEILSKFDELLKTGRTLKLKKVLPAALITELDHYASLFGQIELQDLVNNYMSAVLPNSTISKIRSEVNNSNGAYELREALKKGSILSLLTFLRGLESTKQEHLLFSFCTKAFCEKLSSALD